MTSHENTAHLTEVFSSVQGEGPYVGTRQIFIRLYGCHRRCVYCDSPETVTAWQPPGFKPAKFKLEETPGARDFADEVNPVTPEQLVDFCLRFDQPRGLHHSIAVTGGEPLLHADFLRDAFAQLRDKDFKTYLETAGDLYHELEKVLPVLDFCAMDIKLPSVTQNEAAWVNHGHFLERCMAGGVDVFTKVIVSGDTDSQDILRSVRVVADAAADIPFIIQPMTPFGEAVNPPRADQLLAWQQLAQEKLSDVRIIPQCHKMMGQL